MKRELPKKLRVLFWVSPITEMAWPLQKHPWVKVFVPRIQNAFRACGYDVESTLAISENLAAWMSSAGVVADGRVVAIPQGKLLGEYRYNALVEFVRYQETRRGSRFFSNLGKVVKDALGEDFCPDVVVSFSPSPFFKTIYPRALLLYHEYGMLSRTPYPETFYLDPYGATSRNFVAEHAALLNAVPADAPFLELLDRYRTAVRKALCSNEFLDNYFRGIAARFRKTLLLPLGYEGFADARVNFPYQTQLEYVEHVLDVVPEDTAVILTQHVYRRALDDTAVSSLKALHANLFNESWYSNVPFFSQVAIPYCDACVTQSSSLGYQAIFHKRLFVSVGGFCGGVADAHSVEGIRDVFSKEPMDRDRFLVWVLRNHVADADDLPVHLQGLLDAWLDNPHEVDSPDDWPVSCSLDRFRRRIERWIDKISPPALNGATMRVYFDVGNGFSEKGKFVWRIAEGWPVFHLDQELELPEGCQSLRYDPSEENVVEVSDLQLVCADGELPLSWHNGCAGEGGIVFHTTDPQLVFKLPPGIRNVTLRATVRKVGERESVRALSNVIRDTRRQLSEKTSKLDMANGFLATVDKLFKARDAKEEESRRRLLAKTEECGRLGAEKAALAKDCATLRGELRTAEQRNRVLDAGQATLRRQTELLRRQLRTAQEQIEAKTIRKRFHRMVKGGVPYGAVCAWKRMAYGIVEDKPLFAYSGVLKRCRRVVKFLLPYCVVVFFKRMLHGRSGC